MNKSFQLRKGFYLLTVVSLLFGLTLGTFSTAQAQEATPGTPAPASGEDNWQVFTNEETGMVRFMSGDAEHPLLAAPTGEVTAQAGEVAAQFLLAYGPRFGLNDPAANLTALRTTSDEAFTYLRYQQTYQGIPVVGGEMIVEVDAAANVLAASGKVAQNLNLDTTPRLDAAAAQQMALSKVSEAYDLQAADLTAGEPQLVIYDALVISSTRPAQQALAWKVIVSPTKTRPLQEYVFIDAQNGAVLLQYNNVDTALSRSIYDCENWYSCYLKRSEGQGPSFITEVDNAYDFLGETYNFYKTNLNRDSIDNRGFKLTALVRYSEDGSDFQNAFWDGDSKLFVFGRNYTVDDVIAHEYTHGVTQYESNLIYLDQSGAINEALSDVFGEFVDLLNSNAGDPGPRWAIGEQAPGGIMRSMQDPTLYGDPDKISSGHYYCGYTDNGGVHWNSGVTNKAAYLITDGGSFNGYTVTGIGIPKTAKLFYEAQANLLTSSSDYPDLYNALNQSCSNLTARGVTTGSDCVEVKKALDAVEMYKTPCIGERGYLRPDITKLQSPSGAISTINPSFIWKAKADVTDYLFRLKDQRNQTVYEEWINASTCNGGPCVFTPPVNLTYGASYKWAVQTKNPVGFGLWTADKLFSITPAGALTEPPKGPVSPSEGPFINSLLPTFAWGAVKGVSDYVLDVRVSGSTAIFGTATFQAAKACPGYLQDSGPGTCQGSIKKKLAPNTTYEWSIKAKQGTLLSTGTFTPLTTLPVPGAAVLNSPAEGDEINTTLMPTFRWTPVPNVTQYILSLQGGFGKLVYRVDHNLYCAANCVFTVPDRLDGGVNTATLQAVNGVGAGPISPKRTFTITLPIITVGAAPVGDIDHNRPDFQWADNPLAVTYTLMVTGPTPFTKVAKAKDICPSGMCTMTPSMPLKGGVYTWKVKAANKAGFTISDEQSFTTPAQAAAPAVPVLTSPAKNASVDHASVDLIWNTSAGASTYFVSVTYPTRQVARFVQDASGCGATCTLNLTNLPTGKYKWTVVPSAKGVFGTPANGAFTAVLSAPTVNGLSDAVGLENHYQPILRWEPMTDAATYTVQVLDAVTNAVLLTKTVNASSCPTGSSVCQQPIVFTWPEGSYAWSVRAVNKAGAGMPRITDFDFIRNSNNQFTGGMEGWGSVWGTWYSGGSGKYLETTASPSNYGWFMARANQPVFPVNTDYQVMMKRTGGLDSSNVLFLHTVMAPGNADTKGGYRFQYTNSGYFCVIKAQDGYIDWMQPWMKTTAIKKSGWNLLRVVQKDDGLLLFYINGIAVWAGYDTTYTAGDLMISMYKSQYDNATSVISVDWVSTYGSNKFATPDLMPVQSLGAQSVPEGMSPDYYIPGGQPQDGR